MSDETEAERLLIADLRERLHRTVHILIKEIGAPNGLENADSVAQRAAEQIATLRDEVERLTLDQVVRCERCGGPIVPDGENGCWASNCSQRPMPERRDDIGRDNRCKQAIADLRAAIERLTRERDTEREVLAALNRDGGHLVQVQGYEAARDDALRRWYATVEERDEARRRLDDAWRYLETLERERGCSSWMLRPDDPRKPSDDGSKT